MIQCNVNNLTVGSFLTSIRDENNCSSKNSKSVGIVDKEILLENLKANYVPEDFVKIDVRNFYKFLDERRNPVVSKSKE